MQTSSAILEHVASNAHAGGLNSLFFWSEGDGNEACGCRGNGLNASAASQPRMRCASKECGQCLHRISRAGRRLRFDADPLRRGRQSVGHAAAVNGGENADGVGRPRDGLWPPGEVRAQHGAFP